jgi:outer membrane protein
MSRIIFTFIAVFLYSFNGFAVKHVKPNKRPNPYFRDDYAVNNNFSTFKIYGIGSFVNNTEENWPDRPEGVDLPLGPDKKNLIKYGIGLGGSLSTFFNNYIGVDMGIHGIGYIIDRNELNIIDFTYNKKVDNGKDVNIKDTTLLSAETIIYSVPAHLMLEFCIAPYGGIRPYIGAGYHVNYIYSPFTEFDIDFMHGPVVKAGIDFVGDDDTIYSIEVKKYIVSDTKINYKKGFINGVDPFSTTTDFSPWVISLGIGVKF